MKAMSRAILAGLIWLLALAVSATVTLAQPGSDAPIYRFDPSLVVDSSRPVTLSADPQVVVDKSENQANVRLQTDGPVSPYLDAESGPELSPEELRLLSEGQKLETLSDYRLEAGVGLFVEDRASVNLGYRFHSHPSLLDERRNDPLSLSGDLRISFDIKVPFD